MKHYGSKQANNAVAVLSRHARLHRTPTPPLRAAANTLTPAQDSDTNPNTTASSVAGDAPVDGRKKRAEALNMRKSIYGKKHDRLGASKVATHRGLCAPCHSTDTICSSRKTIPSAASDTSSASPISSATSSTRTRTRTSRRFSPRSTAKMLRR